MKIHKIVNRVAGENTYILENNQHCLVIDPGSDWNKIKNKLNEVNKPILAILLTHTHYDHIMSLDKVRDTFAHPPVYVAESEASWLYTPELSGFTRHPELENFILQPAENFFHYNENYELADFRFYVVPTPGHSIGGVSLIFPEDLVVFTGDALFFETIGRTDLYTGDLPQLLNSIRQQLFTLSGDYEVFPGHGRNSTINHEKYFNPFFH
ncbi:MAG: MBL fold metallo-hydrolase [Streptococcus sp.]|nr:MBL fold metallo-hydrolase [Streptococcus sp.]